MHYFRHFARGFRLQGGKYWGGGHPEDVIKGVWGNSQVKTWGIVLGMDEDGWVSMDSE